MKLEDCRLVFFAIGLIGILLIATPTLSAVLHLPNGEEFSELYVLGPGRMAENYPFSVLATQNYDVYIGVCNHIGSSCYYLVSVKFGSFNDPLPNSTFGIPSPLSPLYSYRLILEDMERSDVMLRFSFSNVTFSQKMATVGAISLNDVEYVVNKESIWNKENGGFFYKLFVELWIYNPTLETFEFNNRFVGLQINMTATT
jgi:hypothetical protein